MACAMLRFDMGAWRVRINGRRLAVILVITCTITPVFNVLTSEMLARSALQGLVDGLIIPPLVAGFWTDLLRFLDHLTESGFVQRPLLTVEADPAALLERLLGTETSE